MQLKQVLCAILVASATRAAAAQSPATVDSLVARARDHAIQGDSAAGRALLDSALASKLDNVAAQAELTYWRTRLESNSADRERVLTTFVVDYSFSTRTGSALFDLGMIELSHGDRD